MIKYIKISAPLVVFASVSICIPCLGQLQTIPAAVTGNFTSLYPQAKIVDWKEKTANFQVFFSLNNAKCEAKFDRDGKWLSTERKIALNSLPAMIKMNMWFSKYAYWQILSAFEIELPGMQKQFHVVVAKAELPNRILFFTHDGKLLKENVSL